MAAKPLNAFLKEYFKLLRLHEMRDDHTEQWAHFEDMITSGDMTKSQKDWADKLLQKSGGAFVRVPANGGEYQIIDLPVTHDNTSVNPPIIATHDELSDTDWETLFRICQNVYFLMSQDRASYADNSKVIDFLNEWQHIFTDTNQASLVAAPETKRQFKVLADLLKNPKHKDFLQKVVEKHPHFGGILGSGINSYQSLINGIETGKYDTDEKFQEKVKVLASAITRVYEDRNNPLHDDFIRQVGPQKPQLFLIHDSFGPGWVQPNINPTHLRDFKVQYPSLFKTLYKDNKVLDAFKSKEGSDNRISAAVEGAKNDIDYDKSDSKNFVTPKRDDALTPMQQIQKWARNKYEDCFEKYAELTGDRMFFSPQAKEIANIVRKIARASDKSGLKPTDGIKGLLDKRADIAKAVKHSPLATDHFDWMIKTLDAFNNDPNMSKTMAGALKNGTHMHNLISELIIKAVEDNKVEQAKTAMEVLSVMKYGAITSKIMDIFRKQEFSLFGDGGLSWNKNQGVQFVTRALDRTIKFAFDAAGYIVTVIGNEYRLMGSKYNNRFQHGAKDKSGAKLKQLSDARDNAFASERAIFNADKAASDAIDIANRTHQKDLRKKALGYLRINETDPNAEQLVNDKEHDTQTTLKSTQAAQLSRLQPLQDRLDAYEEVRSLLERKESYETELSKLNSMLSANPTNSAQFKAIEEEIKLVATDMRNIKQSIRAYNGFFAIAGFDNAPLNDLENKTVTDLENHINALMATDEYTHANDNYQKTTNKIARREQMIQQFRNAEAEIKNLDAAMKKRQKQYDNWDNDHKNVYEDLLKFWDMLETGRDSHTGVMYKWFGSKKKKQDAFFANAPTYIANYSQSYGRVS